MHIGASNGCYHAPECHLGYKKNSINISILAGNAVDIGSPRMLGFGILPGNPPN